jgi:hypothetical protein
MLIIHKKGTCLLSLLTPNPHGLKAITKLTVKAVLRALYCQLRKFTITVIIIGVRLT